MYPSDDPATWEEAAEAAAQLVMDGFPRPLFAGVNARLASIGVCHTSLKSLPTEANFVAMARSALWFMREIDPEPSEWDLMDAIVSLIASKQRDYGHDNINAYGQMGVLVRISDKVARLKNLTATGADPTNEALDDTLIDIVGYCLIGIMLQRGTFNLELAPQAPAALLRTARLWSGEASTDLEFLGNVDVTHVEIDGVLYMPAVQGGDTFAITVSIASGKPEAVVVQQGGESDVFPIQPEPIAPMAIAEPEPEDCCTYTCGTPDCCCDCKPS